MYAFVLLVVLGADPPTSPAASADEPRRYHEINRDLRAALRREALAETRPERAAAVVELTDLYLELKHDPRLADSDTLTEYKNKLWGRLIRVKRDVERDIEREASNTDPVHVTQPTTDETTSSLAESLALVGYSSGGPASFLSQVTGSFGGGAIPDYGPQLVALIERTIAPEFWDTVGGPGTIIYYAPLRVLVVRATSEVHHDVGGVLKGLRAAGM